MKIKYRNVIICIAILIIIFGGTHRFLFSKKDKNNNSSNTSVNNSDVYSKEAVNKLKELNLYSKVKNEEYSETLEVAVLDNDFNKDNLNYYLNVDYVENENLVNYINILAKEGLAINEINEIFSNYLEYSNFDIDNAKRYLEYGYKNKDLKLSDIVTRVNLSLDKEFYTNTKKIENPDMYSLVNKYNYLDTTYVPSNLKSLFNISSLKMVDVAADAYEEFIKAAKEDGITLIGTTAYRSASWQKELYDSYVNKDGKDKADTYSARPGYSEHQLGYSVDLNDPTFTGKRLSDEDYKWIKENCYKYGFIIRFPEDKENITGYMHENWHIRYVGKDIAKKINELNVTYDEYYDLYLKK